MNGFPPSWSRRRAKAFSLIEVTLALGIVTFALVGVIGVLPVAMNSSRQSVDKNRAASIADTVYASFRSQPFQAVAYLDTQLNNDGSPNLNASGLLDLNALPSDQTPPSDFYVTFLDVAGPTNNTDNAVGIWRRLCFTSTPSGGGATYRVTMHFNNNSDPANPVSGMVIAPVVTSVNKTPKIPAQANQVELIISPIGRPADKYRFVSIIANRTN